MITVTNLSLSFGAETLFKDVDIKFTPGNCYGIIGANGAGKSTFIKILSGEKDPSSGSVTVSEKTRMSTLKQDQFAYDEYSVLDTIIMGNKRLYDIGKEKDALYAKSDFSDEDGVLAGKLEEEFAELNGWEAEMEASKLIQGLGFDVGILDEKMSNLKGNEKVKILLAQALFGNPDILLLDEPTNNLDIDSTNWLEDFLLDYEGTVIVVSHDRHFLNTVCTHIVDIDFGQVKLYVGNYEFWYESSQLMQRLLKQQNKKAEEKIKDLQNFVARFSANKSKSRQATSRKKLIEKLQPEEMPASSRKYPFVGFTIGRELGKDVLEVKGLSASIDGRKVIDDVSFTIGREDKVAFVGENEQAVTALFKILTDEMEADNGSFKWGVSTSRSYFPKDNSSYFDSSDLNIIDWMRQFTTESTETYLRGFLGKMLFSGDEVYKDVKVLSGGEKVRVMLSKMMMADSNVIILDDPTNHLDLESITAVNNGLIAYKGVVLFSSHDHEFIETVATRVIEFDKDGKITDYNGTYDEYIEKKHSK